MVFRDLLFAICHEYHIRYSRWPTKTKLLKLAYLADIYHKRRLNSRLLSEPWIYYLYGPYRLDYDEVLSGFPFLSEDLDITDEKTAKLISLDLNSVKPSLSFDERNTVVGVVTDYGDLSLQDLLNYVYFETEPMMNAENRMEELNFETVQPSSYYTVRKLTIDPRREAELRKKFKETVRQFKK